MKILTAVKTIMKVCSDQTKNKNCAECILFRNVRNEGGSGCIMQTAPCDYDVALIAKNILQGEQS